MAPRFAQIGMALLLMALGWMSSWRGHAAPSASELTRLTERAVTAVAQQARVAEEDVRMREVQPVLESTGLSACASVGEREAALVPGYRMVLVANNTIYEYHGAMDCIVPVPWMPDGRASEPVTTLGERVLVRGSKTGAAAAARAVNIWQMVGAEEERARVTGPFRQAENDSFYRLHLGYLSIPAAPPVVTLVRTMP